MTASFSLPMPQKHWAMALLSFLLVLFLMPLGHALMIFMEHTMNDSWLHISAFLMGFIGMAIVIFGIFVNGDTKQTLFGLFGGLLFWTGWVEFLFAYYAARYGVHCDLVGTGIIETTSEYIDGILSSQHFNINGIDISEYSNADIKALRGSRPEYLILPATFGIWMMVIMLYMLCTSNGCLFFNWLQRNIFRNHKQEICARPMTRHVSMVTFMELMMILWSSYLLLMICYDPNFLGDSHPITFVLGLICLISAFFMFRRQLRLPTWGANIRLSIATVIIFWTPIEIMGRNHFFKEIWLAPMDHTVEIVTMLCVFFIICSYIIFKSSQRKRTTNCKC